MSVQQLMNNLLEYVVEQSKSVDPAAYNLRRAEGFKKYKTDLTDLPGVEFDVAVAGDHLWLQVQRLREKPAPQLMDPLLRQFVVVSQDPLGNPPKAKDAALAHRHATDIAEQGQEKADLANTVRRAAVATALESLRPSWEDWSTGELPRRRTMSLYGDLFALKFRLEAEESRKPWELVWGIGIAAWAVSASKDNAVAKGADFVYPLLTQAVELSLDRQTHAISIRPRASEPRLELDAFSALHVSGVVEVERAAKQLLTDPKVKALSPFDASSYEPILKLVQGALTATGSYTDQLSHLPPRGRIVVVPFSQRVTRIGTTRTNAEIEKIT